MMTPKERMLTAIRHEEPDRVPCGEWQFGREIIEPVVGHPSLYSPSLEKLQAYWDGRRNEVIDAWKNDLVTLVRKLNWDGVLVHLAIDENAEIEKPESIGEDTWRTASGDVLNYSRETDRMFVIEKGEGTPQSTASPEPVSPEPTDSELEVARHVVKELGETHFIFSAAMLGHPRLRYTDATSGGEVEAWVQLYEDPDDYLEKGMRRFKEGFYQKGVAVAKREGIDGIAYGCDYGATTGPFMSPDMFKKYVQPIVAAAVEITRDAGLIFMHHACGDNRPLMDMIVEAGVDVYQSIQPEMDIFELKKRYGKNITLWGGVDSGKLILSDPETVYAESKRCLEELMPGGGYVFASSHSLMPQAKFENYQAMLDARDKFGDYS